MKTTAEKIGVMKAYKERMTDEEKAEEYARQRTCFENGLYPKSTVRQAYLDGLAEGRKEGLEVIKFDRLEDVMIAMVESDCIDPCDIAKVKRYILDLEKENTELKEQNEKMKCCGNCLNRIDGQESKDSCKINWDCEKYINWRFEE